MLRGGGYLFTMCSGTDSYDIALAAEGCGYLHPEFDHDPIDPQAQERSTSTRPSPFKDFRLVTDPNDL
jgi:hypothetical protein